MHPFNFAWAFENLCAGKAVSRDAKTWAGKKLFLVRKRSDTVDKKHPYYPHCKGDTIIPLQVIKVSHGVASPYIPSNEDFFAEDWRHA